MKRTFLVIGINHGGTREIRAGSTQQDWYFKQAHMTGDVANNNRRDIQLTDVFLSPVNFAPLVENTDNEQKNPFHHATPRATCLTTQHNSKKNIFAQI